MRGYAYKELEKMMRRLKSRALLLILIEKRVGIGNILQLTISDGRG